MTHLTAVSSQLSTMENVNNISMQLNAISQQVKHTILQLVLYKVNKDPNYPPADS